MIKREPRTTVSIFVSVAEIEAGVGPGTWTVWCVKAKLPDWPNAVPAPKGFKSEGECIVEVDTLTSMDELTDVNLIWRIRVLQAYCEGQGYPLAIEKDMLNIIRSRGIFRNLEMLGIVIDETTGYVAVNSARGRRRK